MNPHRCRGDSRKGVFYMKNTVRLLGTFVLMLVGINCLSAQTRSQLQDMYVSYLRGEGYNPSIDSDGDVNFTAQGHRFYIDVMDNDLQSFHVVLTDQITIGPDRLRALEAASQETRTTRVARVYMTSGGRIAIDAYIFLARPDDFRVVLNRMVDVILIARRDYITSSGG